MHRPHNGAEIVLRCLIDHGVDTVFAYPGGATLPIHQALTRVTNRLRTILPRHEQGGGFAASGYARATGKVGVCFATSGPGATNLVTCLADAQRHAVPLVAITGQVQRHVLGTDAFQEIPIVSVCRAITKHHYLVTRVEDVARVMKEALHVATTGRPGPVIVDVPKDIQAKTTEADFEAPVRLIGYRPERWEHPCRLPETDDVRSPAAELVLRRLHQLLCRREMLTDTFLTTGSGPEHGWVAQAYHFPGPRHWIHSDSIGAIGFALAAALGVQAGHPGKTVVAVDTAESFLANVHELACAFVEKLPVKVLLFNSPAEDADSGPDFVELARGFRGAGATVQSMNDVDDALSTMLGATVPFVLDVQVPCHDRASGKRSSAAVSA